MTTVREKAQKLLKGPHGIVPHSPFAGALDVCAAYLDLEPVVEELVEHLQRIYAISLEGNSYAAQRVREESAEALSKAQALLSREGF
jgi:hypothetical protein